MNKNPIVPDGFVRVSDLRKSSDARIGEYGRRLVERAMHDGIDEGTSLVCLMVDVADEAAYELVPDELLEWALENESWFKRAWERKAVEFRGDIFSYIADVLRFKVLTELMRRRECIMRSLLLAGLEGMGFYAIDERSAICLQAWKFAPGADRPADAIEDALDVVLESVYWHFADEYGDAAAMKARRHCKRSALCGGRIPPTPCFLSMDDARRINGETENYWNVFTAYWADMLDEWR